MTPYLLRNLESHARLTQAERAAVEALGRHPAHEERRQRTLYRQGEAPGHLLAIEKGWGYRCKLLEDGRRQILAFLLPGDFCRHGAMSQTRADHDLVLYPGARVRIVPGEAYHALRRAGPGLQRALDRAVMAQEAILRQWLTVLGQLQAPERLAHLLCEIHDRLERVGATGETFEIPATQADLADAIGLSSVHVNRTLRDLRAAGLVRWSGRRVALPDLARLRRGAGYDPAYLGEPEGGAPPAPPGLPGPR